MNRYKKTLIFREVSRLISDIIFVLFFSYILDNRDILLAIYIFTYVCHCIMFISDYRYYKRKTSYWKK